MNDPTSTEDLNTASGQWLHRGGQELELAKLSDRFTICPAPNSAIDWTTRFATITSLPPLPLLEIEVMPDRLEQTMRQARSMPEVAYASHIYEFQQQKIYLTDQLTVQFSEDVTAEQMRSIAAETGLQVLRLVATGVPKAFVFQAVRSVVNPLKLSDRLMQYSDVVLAEPNVAVSLRSEPTTAIDSAAVFAEFSISAVWERTRGSRAVCVAVIDPTIDPTDSSLQGMGKIISPVYLQPVVAGMGTRYAQLIAAEQEDRAIGLAPGCALMPLQIAHVVDDGAIEQIVQQIADAAVALCSWELTLPLSLRQRVALTAVHRGQRDCVVVASIGETGSELAQHPDVLAVGSGTNPFAGEPALIAAGETSGIAAAAAAGVVALMRSINPALRAAEVRQVLAETADKPAAKYDRQGRSRRFGYGKINADRAVQRAEALRISPRLPARWIELSSDSPIDIPDGNPDGLVDQIATEATDRLLDIEIQVQINHSFLGDIEIWLSSPAERSICLQSRTLGNQTQLHTTYSPQNTPALRGLMAESIAGIWQLRVIDRVPQHTGTLQSWRLRLGV